MRRWCADSGRMVVGESDLPLWSKKALLALPGLGRYSGVLRGKFGDVGFRKDSAGFRRSRFEERVGTGRVDHWRI